MNDQKRRLGMQDQFLEDAQKFKVTIDLVNGDRLTGILVDADNYCVKLRQDEGKPAIFYKRNIVSISQEPLSYHPPSGLSGPITGPL